MYKRYFCKLFYKDRYYPLFYEKECCIKEELREWYDGYYTAARERIYNPRSIVCALFDNQLSNYWTSFDLMMRFFIMSEMI